MLERDRLALRKQREEFAALDAAVEEERLRPLNEARQKYERSVSELAEFSREAALRDPLEIFEPTIFAGIPRSTGAPPDVKAAIGSGGTEFAKNEAGYLNLPESDREDAGEKLFAFLIRNQLDASSPAAWRKAWDVLTFVGAIVPGAPDAKPEPTPEPEPQPVIQTIPEPNEYDGWDIATGRPKKYTHREVETMSGDTYRRAFKLWGDRRPRFVDPRRWRML